MLQENQAQQSTVEYELTHRYDWAVTLAYAGTSGSGSVALDIDLGDKSGVRLRITKTMSGNGVQIAYLLAMVLAGTVSGYGATGTETVVPLGQLVLSADATIGNPANPNHAYADSGLALVQAALVVSEPNIKAQADGLLFPAPAQGQPERVIQAVRDWVAFTRRRERQCAPDAVPAQPQPTRRYRVLEVTADNPDQARSEVAKFQQAIKDPAALASVVQALLQAAGQDKVQLVLTYAGGSATALSDLVAAEADWKTFSPGKAIQYAAIGAIGESDAALQLDRLATFKAAIRPDSVEVKGAPEDALVPYPDTALPDDADGILLLITVRDAQPVAKTDLLTVGVRSGAVTHVVPYFQKQLPQVTASFQDNVPQGTALATFVSQLPPGVVYSAVTLWSTTATIDSGAQARATAVRDAVAQAGRMDAAAPVATQVLTATLLAQLQGAGGSTSGIDDVIAVELNQQ